MYKPRALVGSGLIMGRTLLIGGQAGEDGAHMKMKHGIVVDGMIKVSPPGDRGTPHRVLLH